MSFKNAMKATQKSILQYARQGRPYEIISAILMARNVNNTITETDLKTDIGKSRQFKISFYETIGHDGITPLVKSKQVFFELKRTTASAVYQLNRDDVRYVDGAYTFSDHAKAAINAALPAIRRKLAMEISNFLVSAVGFLPDGNIYRMLPFLDNENGAINPMGLSEIQRIYRDAGLTSPFVVSGADVFCWRETADTSHPNRSNAYYDSLINDAFNDDSAHVISFDPQMLKFVSFNRNAGIFATDLQNIDAIDAVYQRGGTDYIEGVMADPLTGLLWDLNVNYDKHNYRWTFQWKLEWDIFVMPSIGYEIAGMNGIFHFLINTNNTDTHEQPS